jgi:hypothetical protein
MKPIDAANKTELVVQQMAQELADNLGNRVTRTLVEGLAVQLRAVLSKVLASSVEPQINVVPLSGESAAGSYPPG